MIRLLTRLTSWLFAWLSGLLGVLLLVVGMALYTDATREPKDPTPDIFSGVYLVSPRADREIHLYYSVDVGTGRVTLLPGLSAAGQPGGGVGPTESLRLILVGGATFVDGVEVDEGGNLTREPVIRTTTVQKFFNRQLSRSVPAQVITLYPSMIDASLTELPDLVYTFPSISGFPRDEVVHSGSTRVRVTLPQTVGVLPVGCTADRAGVDTVPVDIRSLAVVQTSAQPHDGGPTWWTAGHCTKSVRVGAHLSHDSEWRLDVSSRSPDSHSNTADWWSFDGPRNGQEGTDLANLTADYVSGRRQERTASTTALAGLLVGIGGSLLATEVSVRAASGARRFREKSRAGRVRGVQEPDEQPVSERLKAEAAVRRQVPRGSPRGLGVLAAVLVLALVRWVTRRGRNRR